MTRKLISRDQAKVGKVQHTKPCNDCPMHVMALPGWLGGSSPDEYVRLAHSDHLVPCHTTKRTQCAGMAIYRRNVCKRVEPPNLVLPVDRLNVFASPMEFLTHHKERPSGPSSTL